MVWVVTEDEDISWSRKEVVSSFICACMRLTAQAWNESLWLVLLFCEFSRGPIKKMIINSANHSISQTEEPATFENFESVPQFLFSYEPTRSDGYGGCDIRTLHKCITWIYDTFAQSREFFLNTVCYRVKNSVPSDRESVFPVVMNKRYTTQAGGSYKVPLATRRRNCDWHQR